MSASQPYVRHYDVPLLDDIHNYFPDLLYAPVEQFQSVASVLNYVRQQVRERFDLYSAGARAARGSAPAAPRQVFGDLPGSRRSDPVVEEEVHVTYSTEIPNMRPVPLPPVSGAAAHLSAAATHDAEDVAVMNNLINVLMGGMTAPALPRAPRRAVAPSSLDTLNLLNLAFSGAGAAGGGLNLFGPAPTVGVPANFMEPVPVRPTAAQIAEGTVIETVDAEEEVCAICQDEMPAGSEARALRACDHRFHVGCIDTWFQRDVRCPVCRHDIREAVATSSS